MGNYGARCMVSTESRKNVTRPDGPYGYDFRGPSGGYHVGRCFCPRTTFEGGPTLEVHSHIMAPSEHPNPNYNRLKWVVHLPENGTIGVDPRPHAGIAPP